MNKKTFKTKVKEVQNLMNLNHYDIDVVFDKQEDSVARIRTNDSYLWATLYMSETSLKKDSYEESLHTIVHELCHILTDPLYNIAINSISNREVEMLERIRESTTEHFARLLVRNIK